MTDNNNRVIYNLDEIMGHSERVVRWKDVEYSIKASSDLSPDEYLDIMRLGERFSGLKDIKNDGELSKEIKEAVDLMFALIAPSMSSVNVPFTGRVFIIEFWKSEEEKIKKITAAENNT